jgi:hypothetical protein
MNLNLRYALLAVVVSVVLVLGLVTLTEEAYAIPWCSTVCIPQCSPTYACWYLCGREMVKTNCGYWCTIGGCE